VRGYPSSEVASSSTVSPSQTVYSAVAADFMTGLDLVIDGGYSVW
jgi:hypothetical protein